MTQINLTGPAVRHATAPRRPIVPKRYPPIVLDVIRAVTGLPPAPIAADVRATVRDRLRWDDGQGPTMRVDPLDRRRMAVRTTDGSATSIPTAHAVDAYNIWESCWRYVFWRNGTPPRRFAGLPSDLARVCFDHQHGVITPAGQRAHRALSAFIAHQTR